MVSTVQLKDEFPKRLPTLQRIQALVMAISEDPRNLFKKTYPQEWFCELRWLLCLIPNRTLTTQCSQKEEQVVKLNSNWYNWSLKNMIKLKSNAMQRLMEEILHQLLGSLSRFLQGFIHAKWCRTSSINRII